MVYMGLYAFAELSYAVKSHCLNSIPTKTNQLLSQNLTAFAAAQSL